MFRLILAALATIAAAVATHAANPSADEVKNLQGEWQAVETLAQGKKRDKDDTFVQGLKFIIKGEELVIPNPTGTRPDRRKTYKLDSAKSPKEIDLTHHDGAEKDRTTAAIYRLDGDRLTICMPYFTDDLSLRPTEFKATADDGRMLITLERAKPK